MARALLLYNPAARNAPEPQLVRALCERISWGGFVVEAQPSRGRGDLARLAATAAVEGFDRVVACGGDGTVREVVQGLGGSGIPLAVIPLGTANVLSREIGLPANNPLACARFAGGGRAQAIYIGDVGGEAFTFSASVGLDARTVEGVDLKMKGTVGPLAYAYCGVRELLSRPQPVFLVELAGGEQVEASQVFVQNAKRYGLGRLTLSGEADLTRPTLQVVALRAPLMGRLALLLPRFLAGGLEGAPGVFSAEVGAVRVSGPPEEPIQADGDTVATLPAEFRVRPDPIQLIFPD